MVQERTYIVPNMNRAMTPIFCPVFSFNFPTCMIGNTRIATSSKRCVIVVPKKNLEFSILHVASGMVLSQKACTGTQWKMVIKVRMTTQMTDMTNRTWIAMRIGEVLKRRQYMPRMAYLEKASEKAYMSSTLKR